MTGKYQFFPDLPGDIYSNLERSILQFGVKHPIVVNRRDGEVVDGFHRAKICAAHGIECPRVEVDLPEEQAATLARRLNADRRHLTEQQQRDAVAGRLIDSPERSDRQIAAESGTTHRTVAKVRRELEATGELGTVSSRIGADGRTRRQPARKPATPKPPPKRRLPPVVERPLPPAELRDPLKEFDAVVERELDKLERVTFGRPAAYALRRACNRLRTAVADLLRATKADV
ncbi:hypothetical protein BTH42_22485 [Burkholderia sp. SRS-W-2-2016]|uniref:ParB N-terminal domain-containing protein n=1 Tax=Burkholderia sp. SRS-W-2-2016 TaxID=1926878 RepID=UPI00094AA6D6|nr:ParB/RepB/Spo0J family partition protein [Burkholderia sp. SRS-W-2-2016]OLL29501.1 hypothetical protein BTH42_22485 [Burkholderia sp. SRS-W-2-2016]